MSEDNIQEEDVKNARLNWQRFVKSAKWTVITIGVVVLLLGITFTDLF